MCLMSASIVSRCSFVHLAGAGFHSRSLRVCSVGPFPMRRFGFKRRRPWRRWVPSGKKRRHLDKRPWWQKLFSDEGGDTWFDWSAEDVFGDGNGVNGEEEDEVGEDEKFQAWKRRAEAISELREAQEDARNAEGREWEDWLQGDNTSSWEQELEGRDGASSRVSDDPEEIMREKGLVGVIRSLVLGDKGDDLLFEDRVFRYASTSSVKFVALLVIVPWAVSFLVHDYVLMPFLDRYVKTVPFAAEMLDVRRHQKLEMVKTLKTERARFRLEVEIGKSPPLSEEEIWWELRKKANADEMQDILIQCFNIARITVLLSPMLIMIELRDEWRLENRKAFANIWSDMVYGIVLFMLICVNKSKVALLKFTGYKLLSNVSDTGKAFLIILVTDIFLGYHSESGWQVLIEIILERYGLEVDQAAITIFICTFPVIIDACVKLWLFKFLPKLSPNVSNIFREMQRH